MIKCEQENKTKIVMNFALRNEVATKIASDNNVSRDSLYKWSKELLSKESYENMKHSIKTNARTNNLPFDRQLLVDSIQELQNKNKILQFENDISQKATEILKKK